MRKLALTAAALGAVLATPALAQTYGQPAYGQPGGYGQAPLRAPFTGPRIEGVLGYDNLSDGGDEDSSSSSGLLYGAAVGYDLQAGPVVAGIEGEVTGSTTDTRTDNLVEAGDRFRLDAGRDLYVGGRVGYVISPLAMVYAKAGYTNARVEERYDVGNDYYRDHQDLSGFRVGAGLEYNLTPSTYVKGEYRYSHYGHIDNGDGYGGYDVDVDRHQLVGGIGLRF